MLLIKNARLEKGYTETEGRISSTKTEIKDILIDNTGKFKQIENSIDLSDEYVIYDAKKQLLLPAFMEKHVHIDKTYFSGPWKAVQPTPEGVFSRIKEEEKLLPDQLHTLKDRARAIVDHLIKNGHTFIRTHVNVDPVVKDENMKLTLEVIEEYKDKIEFEIVAFPQHGLNTEI